MKPNEVIAKKRVVVLGAGIAGHTAAMFLRHRLKSEAEVVVLSPKNYWNWIPSNIWVGVGVMDQKDVRVDLPSVYNKLGIQFIQAKAIALHPSGSHTDEKAWVDYEGQAGRGKLEYDYLINATGPLLNFGATPGLGPDAHTVSVCTDDHAVEASKQLFESIDKMKKGLRQTFVVGMGHGTCTCEGAAFEYVLNLEHELRRHGVRDLARIIFITNEAELGDFGVGGMYLEYSGYMAHSKNFAESLFFERNVEWVLGAHVEKVEAGSVYYENLKGEKGSIPFDFAMLLPPFRGAMIKAFDREGLEITTQIFAPSGFMKVDANYTPKESKDWSPEDWPKNYQAPSYANIFAVGIAFAPPHPISEPRKSPNGTVITPSPPRTGMPSAIMGRIVAENIADMIQGKARHPVREASMAEMGAACVASSGAGFFDGTAASMTMYPIVPDFKKYPGVGRDPKFTYGEVGLAGHWIKKILHHMFIYKAKALPGWTRIPE